MVRRNELLAELVRKELTMGALAKKLGIAPSSLTRKIKGETDFYRGEIEKISQVLDLSGEDVLRIFFAFRLEKTQAGTRKEGIA